MLGGARSVVAPPELPDIVGFVTNINLPPRETVFIFTDCLRPDDSTQQSKASLSFIGLGDIGSGRR